MKASKILLGFACMLLLTSCHKDSNEQSEEETPRIKNFSKLVSPETNTSAVLGDKISFKITSEVNIDSIIMEYGDEKINSTENEFTWESNNVRTGLQRLKVLVYQQGLPVEIHYPRLTFVSDIAPEAYTYQVIKSYPHKEDAYTQGFFFKDDTLYESTGLPAGYDLTSYIAKVNLTTGQNYQETDLGGSYFGEGSTYWKDQIMVLTWTSNIGFIFDNNLTQTDTFKYTHQGWGITTMGDTLVVSDGSETLHFLNPNDFSEFDKLQVYDESGKVEDLNELEYFNGFIYANIYYSDFIVVIDPKSGKVVQKIDMSGLLIENENANVDVLNGIAYNPNNGQIYVTGKLWPKTFQVKFVKSQNPG